MLDLLICVLAWAGLIVTSLVVLLQPLLIGQKREPYSAAHCIIATAIYPLQLLLLGRVLGWW